VVAGVSAAACGGHGAAPGGGAHPLASPGAAQEIDRTTPLPDPLPAVAAQVNGQAIPTPFVSVLANQLLKNDDDVEHRNYAYRRALQQLIDRELLVEEALARGLSADNERVQQIYNESRLHYKNEDAWAAYLANEGLTRDALRTQIRAQLTAQALVEQETSRVPADVSDAEAKAFYDANPSLFKSGETLRVSHILVRVPPGTTPGREAVLRARAEGILARLRKGEDFGKLAKELSEDKASADKGGELAAFGRGQSDPAFEKAAFALKTGEFSGVVATRVGFHVIKLLGRTASERKPYDVIEKRRQQRIVDLLAELRAKAKIETHL
jgi:parvulin-like peptidyl-prolyl isomerase